MRRLPALIAVLALAAAGAAPAFAQAPAQTPPPAAAPAAPKGVTVAETRAWLAALGGAVGEPEAAQNAQILRVADQPLPWNVTFYACANLCDDLQYGATFTGPITEAQVTAWNRDHRYLKAIWLAPETAGGEAAVLARYDLLLTGVGTDQLQEPTFIWLQQLRTFAQYLAGPAAPAAAPAQ